MIGTGTGRLAGLPTGWGPRLAAGLVVLLVLAAGAAALAGLAPGGRLAVPGREGFWLETAALMLVVYLAGCVLGGVPAAPGVRRRGPATGPASRPYRRS